MPKIDFIIGNKSLQKIYERLNEIQNEIEEVKAMLRKLGKATQIALKEVSDGELDFAVSFLSPHLSDELVAKLLGMDVKKYKEVRKLLSNYENQVENIFRLIGTKELILQLADLREAEKGISLRKIKENAEKYLEESKVLVIGNDVKASPLGIFEHLLDNEDEL